MPSRRVVLATLVLACALSSLIAPVRARADIVRGWAWLAQRSQSPSLGAASGVPDGDVAVAWSGQPQKSSYLGVTVPSGADVQSASLDVLVDQGHTNVSADAAQLVACLITTPWSPGSPMGWDVRPVTSCDETQKGTFVTATSTYHFDVTPLARALAQTAAFGISIEPSSAASQPFDVALGQATFAVTLPPPVQPAQAESTLAPEPPVAPMTPVTAPVVPGGGQPVVPTPSGSPSAVVLKQSTAVAAPIGFAGTYALIALLALLPVAGAVARSMADPQTQEPR